jgi:hypothetical protein
VQKSTDYGADHLTKTEHNGVQPHEQSAITRKILRNIGQMG